jgi:pimeloyl-ACP methyl ester carboxylesterase
MKPVYIEGCYGVLHPAAGSHGVVICGPIGDESLNAYRAQVFLGERLASAGFPTLRVSYYGTGDSAGDDDEPARLRAWIDSILAAVRWLRAAQGITAISLCGIRVGAILAACAATELDDVDALILLAPIPSGRRFLREQLITARTVADVWKSVGNSDPDWFEAFGVRLHHTTRESLEALDLGKIDRLPVKRALLLDAPGAPSNDRFAGRMRGEGISITHQPGKACERMLLEAHEAEAPHDAIERIVTWLGAPGEAASMPEEIPAAPLQFDAFHEQVVGFGPRQSLSGVLAEPVAGDRELPVVLIAGTGANPRFGTSRGAVTLARWLARQGIVSFRIDGHGIGDSAIATGEQGMPYAKQGDLDICAGVDLLVARSGGPVIVFGMCSGAYHAFQAALVDRRIAGLILVNLQKFVWSGGESLSVVQRTTLRTTGFYLRNLVSLDMWRRLLRGQINARGIAAALARRAVRQLAAAADPAIAALTGETQVGMVRRQLAELSARPVQILYVLSGNDPGLDEIAEYFGVRGWRLRRSANLTFHVMKRADHTLSAQWARDRLRHVVGGYLRDRFHVPLSHSAHEPSALPAPVPAASRPGPTVAIKSAPTTA